MMRMFNRLTEAELQSCADDPGKDKAFRRLLFGLTFFHSVILERRKFQYLGWNVSYDFNDADFDICKNLLDLYINTYEEIPWESLRYLTSEANYGGRVTDDWDRRLLNVYMNEIYCSETITEDAYSLAEGVDDYIIPGQGSLQFYLEHISSLPSVDEPDVFGQHPNADISSLVQESSQLLATLLSIQPQTSKKETKTKKKKEETGGVKSPQPAAVEDDASTSSLKFCEELRQRIPPLVSHLPGDARTLDMTDEMAPLLTVLLQEAARYNNLLELIVNDLQQLEKGLKGQVVMSVNLEKLLIALNANKIPHSWSDTYPSSKPLASWVIDLTERIKQIQQWAISGAPKVFWLGGLTFPTALLTGLLQQSSRAIGCSVDSLIWSFEISRCLDERDLTTMPPVGEGAYMGGIFLEGCIWDMDKEFLDEAHLMELVSPMPIVHFKPIQMRRKEKRSSYSCPVYYYPNRYGSMHRQSYIITMDLKSGDKSPAHWTKRGVAALLNLGT
ncbi:Dynein axonemal heavy chain 2 [Aduncisulcus paluster]|uniref:Dynein axonemal heavy chain 2 n=1 Tax=Aduncisulcus paluster TaxID=2918883 RepID=A0ABQ5JTI1_9EUKA|nr:Dynein axonemal heavy chain 2 [Aduncisulcus paluster]